MFFAAIGLALALLLLGIVAYLIKRLNLRR